MNTVPTGAVNIKVPFSETSPHTKPVFAAGVTVTVVTIGALVVLVAVKAAILPVPDAAIPVVVGVAVQL